MTLSLEQFITSNNPKLTSVEVDSQAYLYGSFDKDLQPIFKLQANPIISLKYDDYDVLMTLQVNDVFEKADCDVKTRDEIVDSANFSYTLRYEDSKETDFVVLNAKDPNVLDGLVAPTGQKPNVKTRLLFKDFELREEVLLAYCEGLNKDPIYTNHHLDDALIAQIDKQLKQAIKKQLSNQAM